MTPNNKAGFTIIETMLFLGISGLLAMAIFVGTGTTINNQRYRDSVSSFKSYLQGQYTDVLNVNNVNSGCGSSNRGQSDCVILGRLIKTTNGQVFESKPVIGTIPAPGTVMVNDLDALTKYNLRTVSLSETYEMEWGATAKQTARVGGGDLSMSVLILRSPLNGVLRTFIDDTQAINDSDVSDLLTIAANSKAGTICVNSSNTINSPRLGVKINANAAGTNGVESLGDDSRC